MDWFSQVQVQTWLLPLNCIKVNLNYVFYNIIILPLKIKRKPKRILKRTANQEFWNFSKCVTCILYYLVSHNFHTQSSLVWLKNWSCNLKPGDMEAILTYFSSYYVIGDKVLLWHFVLFLLNKNNWTYLGGTKQNFHICKQYKIIKSR